MRSLQGMERFRQLFIVVVVVSVVLG